MGFVSAVSGIAIVALGLSAYRAVNLPWFRAMVVVWIIQIVEGSFTSPYDRFWLNIWAGCEGLLLGLTIAATVELLWGQTKKLDPVARFWVRFGAVSWHVVLYFFYYLTHIHSINAMTPMAIFLQIRTMLGFWTALTMLALISVQLLGYQLTGYAWVWITLAVITGVFRGLSWTGVTWPYYNLLWRIVAAAAAIGWILTFPSPSEAQDTRA